MYHSPTYYTAKDGNWIDHKTDIEKRGRVNQQSRAAKGTGTEAGRQHEKERAPTRNGIKRTPKHPAQPGARPEPKPEEDIGI